MDGNLIKVTGNGCIHVVPDVTRLEVSISDVFETYDAAYSQARENFAWIGKILEYNKKSAKLAKTICFDISDHEINEYSDGDFIGKKKDGFDLAQRIKIDLGIDNDLVNRIVRGVGKFIKGAQINIGYTVQDPRPSKLKMLARAVHDAEEKAKIMAEALGCKLGAVHSVDYSECGLHIYTQARNIHSNSEAMAYSSESLDITPDDLAVSDNVDVSWILEKCRLEILAKLRKICYIPAHETSNPEHARQSTSDPGSGSGRLVVLGMSKKTARFFGLRALLFLRRIQNDLPQFECGQGEQK